MAACRGLPPSCLRFNSGKSASPGASSIGAASQTRQAYARVLKAADARNITPLSTFAQA